MKITSNYQISSRNNKRAKTTNFSSFIKLSVKSANTEVVYSGKAIRAAIKKVEKVAGTIKELTDGNINLYRRTLSDMGFREKHLNEVYSDFANVLFIEDGNGKHKNSLKKVANYLVENNINFESFGIDLFKAKPNGFLSRSNLEIIAYGAKPEQMIKL